MRALLASLVILAGCGTPALGDAGRPDAGDPATLDSDGDGISDLDEGRETRRDSDDDRVPDYLDLDSDDNGIPDEIEGTRDWDLDGTPDYADLDDDGDLVSDAKEIAGSPETPPDSDLDGAPNFRDVDSDNDRIMDGDEFGADSDRDGLFDHEDLDSDGDGILDVDEAGDDDVFSPPVDTDGDAIPDFRDDDSDNDGLSDAEELALGTDPRLADTDGDGVADLIEFAAGSDPTDPDDSPMADDTYVVVVPYTSPPEPMQLEVRIALTEPLASPTDVYLVLEPVDAEVRSFFESLDADASGAGCTARASADRDSVLGDEAYLAVAQDDVLCYQVGTTENTSDPGSLDGATVFHGELVLRDLAGTELWRRGLYYLVPGRRPDL
ncbi:MAG: hypothetical protein AB7S26_19225 [Sandaracinaceae bacterium]